MIDIDLKSTEARILVKADNIEDIESVCMDNNIKLSHIVGEDGGYVVYIPIDQYQAFIDAASNTV